MLSRALAVFTCLSGIAAPLAPFAATWVLNKNNEIPVLITPHIEGQRDDADDRGSFSAVLENDLSANTDGNYTNGVRVAWLSSEKNVPNWAKTIAKHVLPYEPLSTHNRISVALGQSMLTPPDLKS